MAQKAINKTQSDSFSFKTHTLARNIFRIHRLLVNGAQNEWIAKYRAKNRVKDYSPLIGVQRRERLG